MLKRDIASLKVVAGLITVQDNTMLKLIAGRRSTLLCLITVQDNTMLKLAVKYNGKVYSLITVQDNTMLKHKDVEY